MIEIQQCEIGLVVLYRSEFKEGEKMKQSTPCLFEAVSIDVSYRNGGTPFLIS